MGWLHLLQTVKRTAHAKRCALRDVIIAIRRQRAGQKPSVVRKPKLIQMSFNQLRLMKLFHFPAHGKLSGLFVARVTLTMTRRRRISSFFFFHLPSPISFCGSDSPMRYVAGPGSTFPPSPKQRSYFTITTTITIP